MLSINYEATVGRIRSEHKSLREFCRQNNLAPSTFVMGLRNCQRQPWLAMRSTHQANIIRMLRERGLLVEE